MNARPILFSAPMVRALLAGTKTQTRRIVRPQPEWIESSGRWRWSIPKARVNPRCCTEVVTASREWWEYLTPNQYPYGERGDLLWVRENFYQHGGPIEYSADPGVPSFKRRQTPCIHMPRWASRLTLRITDVRAERLNGISEKDARAEGVECGIDCPDHRIAFGRLWESINGPRSWTADPWVWALTFTVEKRNVDELLREAA